MLVVFTTTGGMGRECLRHHSRLAELISIKKLGEDFFIVEIKLLLNNYYHYL